MLTKSERIKLQFVPQAVTVALAYATFRAFLAHDWISLVIDLIAVVTIALLAIAFQDYITKERRRPIEQKMRDFALREGKNNG